MRKRMRGRKTGNGRRRVAALCAAFLIAGFCAGNTMTVCAAPAHDYVWYMGVPKFYSTQGCLSYIAAHGMESYTTRDTFNLEQFLLDNPDVAAAGITDRDNVWAWIVAWDGICPRILHSMNPEEEYYCRARNLCIQLGVYGPTSTRSVKEKCQIIHDEVCRRCSYDNSLSKYTYKNIMDENTGVCNAFSTYGCLMFTIAGVENGFVDGPNHIWNAVRAEDGNWYQIDLTWDAADYNDYQMGEGGLNCFFWMPSRADFQQVKVPIDSHSYYIVSNQSMLPTGQDVFITQDLR